MSIFAVGGNIGYAVGPIIATATILAWGLKGVSIMLPIALAPAIILLTNTKNFREIEDNAIKKAKSLNGKDSVRAFTMLTVLLSIRSIINSVMTSFVPMLFIVVLLQPETFGNSMLTVFAVTNIVANLLGGKLADKFGFNSIMKAFYTAMPLCLLLFTLSKSVPLSVCAVMLVALCSCGPYSAGIALGQQYLPNRVGMASGFALGVTVSIGGLVAPAFGAVSDAFGVDKVMIMITVISITTLILAHILPKPEAAEAQDAPKDLD